MTASWAYLLTNVQSFSCFFHACTPVHVTPPIPVALSQELDKVTIELTLNSTSDNVYKDAHKTINVFNNKCIGDFPGQGIKTFCSNFVPAYSYIYAQNKLFYVSPSSINILYAPTK